MACPPVGGQQPTTSIHPLPGASDSGSGQTKYINEERLYRYLVLGRYRYFIEFVGREGDQVDGGEAARTDYESAVGIGDGDESALLQIVLDKSPRMIETWDEADQLVRNLLDQHKSFGSIEGDPKLREIAREQAELVAYVRAGLMREGSKTLLQRVDAYVFREFINREGPQSVRRDDDFSQEEVSQSNRRNEKSHDQAAFAVFFQIMGSALERVERRPDADPAELIPRCTPKERLQQVISIVKETNNELRMLDFADDAMIGTYHQQNGPQPVPIEEFSSTNRAFWKTTGEGKQKLRDALGETTFKTFAREVADAFGSDLHEEAHSSTAALRSSDR